MEIGKTLGQDRITRARPVFPPAQAGERDRFGRKTRAGERHAVGENLEDDLASGVFVLAVCNRIYQRLTQTIDGILV